VNSAVRNQQVLLCALGARAPVYMCSALTYLSIMHTFARTCTYLLLDDDELRWRCDKRRNGARDSCRAKPPNRGQLLPACAL
jgi:hypothetical protein